MQVTAKSALHVHINDISPFTVNDQSTINVTSEQSIMYMHVKTKKQVPLHENNV